MIIVYHGATCIVKRPLCLVGRPNLDFGQGFYVTDLREQAVNWATRAANAGKAQWLNRYGLDIDKVRANYRCLSFAAYDKDWLDFIVDCRNGNMPWHGYDSCRNGYSAVSAT